MNSSLVGTKQPLYLHQRLARQPSLPLSHPNLQTHRYLFPILPPAHPISLPVKSHMSVTPNEYKSHDGLYFPVLKYIGSMNTKNLLPFSRLRRSDSAAFDELNTLAVPTSASFAVMFRSRRMLVGVTFWCTTGSGLECKKRSASAMSRAMDTRWRNVSVQRLSVEVSHKCRSPPSISS